jgi:hypothetical protein
MSSQSTEDVGLRRKIAKLETARKIERMERMVRDLQATVERKDLEQKIERERKDLEQKMERMQAQAQATLEKKDLEQKMEKRHMEQMMERMQAQAQAALEKKDLEQKMEKNEQQIKRMEADVIMRSENEKRDRLLENEKRDREADKKEAQHQIELLKWEARFSQMEQQQAARAYKLEPLPNPLQYGAATVLPLAPQQENKLQLQPAPLQELRPREEETGPSHSMTLVTAIQPVLPGSTVISAALPSAALPSVIAARPQAASVLQPVQHQHQSTCDTPAPSRPLQQQQQQQQQVQQQQHQVTAGPAARAGPVPLPANARTHFFLSHCQGTGGDQTNAIYLELKQLGFSCW